MLSRWILHAAALFMLMTGAAQAQTETRLALVLGIGAYQTNPMPAALNDAGLMARTLRDLGFSTVEGADLPQSDLRQTIANFIAQLREAGPDAVAVVYVAGLGVQHESDSYLMPADAVVAGEADVPIGGIRLNDVVRALAAVPARARIVLLDVSRQHPFADVGAPVRAGIGLLDGAPGLLIASAAAPGAVSAPNEAAYGHFATALAEQLNSPGLGVDQAVARARLRVHQLTNGRDTPWETARLAPPVPVLNIGEEQSTTAAPPPPADRPMDGLSAQEAYAIAIERDTIEGYQAFLRVYPSDPLARRVKRLLAAKREAHVWRRTVRTNTPQAYWTYLRTYPRGPHAGEARLRLGRLSAPVAPPVEFDEVIFDDIPAPLPEVEVVYAPDFWDEPPSSFYDEVVVVPPTYLGPPVAPVYVLPPPPPPTWGVLPLIGAAALVAAPVVIPRMVRPRRDPVVIRPPMGPGGLIRPVQGGPRPGFGPGQGGPRPGFGPGQGGPRPGFGPGQGGPRPDLRPGQGGPRPGFGPGQGGPRPGFGPGQGGPRPDLRPGQGGPRPDLRPGQGGPRPDLRPGQGGPRPDLRPGQGGPRPGFRPGQGGPRPDLRPGQGGPRPGFRPGQGGPRPGFGPGQGGPRPGFGPGQGGPRPGFGPGQGGPRPGFGPGQGGPRPGFGPGQGGPRPGFGPGQGGPRPGFGPGQGGPRPGFGPGQGGPRPGFGPGQGGPRPGFGPGQGGPRPGFGPGQGGPRPGVQSRPQTQPQRQPPPRRPGERPRS